MNRLAFALPFLFFGLSAHAYNVPALTGPVMDLAGMMSPSDVSRVDAAIRGANNAGQVQLQVVTVPSLNDEPIEEVSHQMVRAWKLGSEKNDNGVLLLVSQGDRRMRVEVGQGLEGAIPDIYAKRIVSDVMIPYFKQGQTSEGIVAGVASILQLAANESGGQLAEPAPQMSRSGRRKPMGWLHIAIFLIFLIFTMMRPRRGGFMSGMVLGGLGGSLGRGGFGGGFGGGGGGFSGGGSSGSW